MRFSVVNLGCKVNAYECEGVARQLEEAGFERVDWEEPAEITVIFTCAVTNTAAAKSRKMIHRARRKHPEGIVAVAGCYAQIDPDALEDADILVGSRHKPFLAEYIQTAIRKKERIVDVTDLSDVRFEPLPVDHFSGRTRAFLKIQDGCNQFCSYCVIPYARGKERSMEPDMVIDEANKIAMTHKEIVLAGIHTGRYGKEYGITLADLIKRLLEEVNGLKRLRISSIEITELDDPFVELFAKEKRIARHLHIPLQSGSDVILKRMGRPYSSADYYNKLCEIRAKAGEFSVSTDLMTGFPGETEASFEETLAFLKKCEFSFLHVFPFSARNGTKAAMMDDQIDVSVRRKRAKTCIALSEELYDAYKDSMIGKPVEVLMENETQGHTSEYLEVTMDQPYEPSSIVPAIITERKGHALYAEGSDEA
jgi:threonylcarbamoyladenosine tRNA methylthiotransferase MtaB